MQPELPFNSAALPVEVQQAILDLATEGDLEERGSVFTKESVVEAILDLCGYDPDRKLTGLRLLEPSFGDGGFLFVAIRRLVDSYTRRGGDLSEAGTRLSNSIRAVELHQDSFAQTKGRVVEELIDCGLDEDTSTNLASTWLKQGDFLLKPIEGRFDVVVGNPPYVRQERIPGPLLGIYRKRFRTLYDRADLYVLFYERCLSLLAPKGTLGFICANRWIKNKYGGPLRALVAREFNLRAYVDMERADAFRDQVDAYPAITIIERGPAEPTAVALGSRDDAARLSDVTSQILRRSPVNGAIAHIPRVMNGRDPWLLDAPEVLPILRALEESCPTVEEAGARVRIGVATGCDRVFIRPFEELPVEPDRKLRLAVGRDLQGGKLVWGGRGVVNPWMPDGSLAPLDEYPLFATYVETHRAALARRHTAKKAPAKWYRTIDRIYPDLVGQEKLLIPDIKGDATVVYDSGTVYPHHNLYVITSDTWNLRALQALLRSSTALMFVAAYCVRMAGGFLRFQAQYLRRIRLPALNSLDDGQEARLVAVAECQDQERLDEVAFDAFGLTMPERRIVADFAAQARVG